MPVRVIRQRAFFGWDGETYHRVISKATMINSFKTRAVYEIATMLMNSVSKKRSERIMMIPPVVIPSAQGLEPIRLTLITLINADGEPLEKRPGRQRPSLRRCIVSGYTQQSRAVTHLGHFFVQLGIQQSQILADILVQNQGEDRRHRVKSRIADL
jgi:hypothetical protein